MYEEYIEIYEEWDENGKRLSSGIPGMYYVNMVNDEKIERSEVTELVRFCSVKKKGANRMMKLSWLVSAVCRF